MEGGKSIPMALFIPLLVIALMAGGAGGYFWAKSNVKEKACAPCPKTTTDTSTEVTSSPTPTSTAIDTSSWKLYDNTKYNYTFRYPQSWGVIDYLYDSLTKSKKDQYKLVLIDDQAIAANALKYASEIPTPTLGFFALDEMPTSYGDLAYEEGTATIDNVTAKKIIYTEPSLLDDTYTTNLYFEKNGQAYSIIYMNNDETGAHPAIIDEIIKTFKFK